MTLKLFSNLFLSVGFSVFNLVLSSNKLPKPKELPKNSIEHIDSIRALALYVVRSLLLQNALFCTDINKLMHMLYLVHTLICFIYILDSSFSSTVRDGPKIIKMFLSEHKVITPKQEFLAIILCFFMYLKWPWLLCLFAVLL